jgi:hypothetical protein
MDPTLQPGQSSGADRVIPPDEKALVKKWNERIEAAKKRYETEFKQFQKNRKLLAGKVEGEKDKKVRANLHFANMAAMLPQVYAKDPEFSVRPSMGIDPAQIKTIKAFGDTSEKLLGKLVTKDAKLKSKAKKMLRSAYATSIGWWKASWQEDRRTDPLITDRIKDTQDNIERIKSLLRQVEDPAAQSQHELKLAELHEAVKGLETQQEVVVARGLALDFVMAEDIIILDESIFSVTDYLQAGAIAHRVWMTDEKVEAQFGFKPKKAKAYIDKNGVKETGSEDKRQSLFAVYEVWDQDSGRIYTLIEGEEGFAKPPESPDWTGRRWYPFFGGAFNEIDGAFYPLSDVELAEKLVEEYNQTREDFASDRKDALPINVVREGGSLTEEDVKRISNRERGQTIVVKGMSNVPLNQEIFSGSLTPLNPATYDTAPSRQDMEMVLGGGDAARGTVMKAKTATEAEIVSQGLRGRSAERQDVMEDVLNELGPYALEMFLRKMTADEVKTIVGQDAVWPELTIEETFNMVSVEVRGGSTGKPDRLQEQDRWLKLMPIIKETIQSVADLREKGQDQLANCIIELTRETLRRFDERLDIEQFIPPAAQGEDDPAMLKQMIVTLKGQLKEATTKAKDAVEQVEKGYVSAAAQIATSADPLTAVQAFGAALQAVGADMKSVDQAVDGALDANPPVPAPVPPTMTAPMPQ